MAVSIAYRRLAASQLLPQHATSCPEILRTLGAVQSQDYPGGKWALGLRSPSLTDAAVEEAFNKGEILRTHVLRPTWHFVAPEDIRWMLALTAKRISAVMNHYGRKLGLDDAGYRRSNAVIERALRGGRHLTRAELAQALNRAKIDATGTQRLARLVMNAELDAVICSGPRRGKQFTYALLDERVPPAKPFSRDESLLELTRRYFATRGPATAQDFAWWSGLTVADARRGIDTAGAELVRQEIDGKTYWLSASAPPPLGRTSGKPVAHLLPNYDEYFIGYKDRGAIGQRLRSVDLVTGGDALTAHVVAIDGQLVGGWKRTVGPAGAVVELKLLDRLTSAEERAVEDASEAFGRFLQLPVELRGLRSSRASRTRR